MMALFIVLWLMSSNEKVKKAVAGYFNDPKGTASLLGTTMSGTGVEVTQNNENLKHLKDKLEEEIKAKLELQKLAKQIEITITAEGLRIELIEDKKGTFFQSGSAQLSGNGQELLALLAAELKTLPNQLLIEGHTDAAKYSSNGAYGNWELSADRANAARRLLQQDGVRSNQVTQVRGYADQFLRVASDPYDPSNRRISILVKNDSQRPGSCAEKYRNTPTEDRPPRPQLPRQRKARVRTRKRQRAPCRSQQRLRAPRPRRALPHPSPRRASLLPRSLQQNRLRGADEVDAARREEVAGKSSWSKKPC